jgi:hypothetical protein
MAWVGPGCMGRRWTGVQAVAGLVWRQNSAVRGPLRLRPSVVREGVVQWSWTWLPMRWAVRSVTTSARFRVGGRGLPGLAQPIAMGISSVMALAVRHLAECR